MNPTITRRAVVRGLSASVAASTAGLAAIPDHDPVLALAARYYAAHDSAVALCREEPMQNGTAVYEAWNERLIAASAAETKAFHTLMETPAESLAGAAAKLRAFAHYQPDWAYPPDDQPTIASLADDIERIAAGGAS